MRLNISNPSRSKAISLTPLIDVVFILLLFFMLSTSFSRWFSVDVSIPKPLHAENINAAHIQLLNDKGFVSYAGTLFETDYARLISTLENEQPDIFLIDSEHSVSTQTIITLLDQLSLAGLKSVSLGQTFKATSNHSLSVDKSSLMARVTL